MRDAEPARKFCLRRINRESNELCATKAARAKIRAEEKKRDAQILRPDACLTAQAPNRRSCKRTVRMRRRITPGGATKRAGQFCRPDGTRESVSFLASPLVHAVLENGRRGRPSTLYTAWTTLQNAQLLAISHVLFPFLIFFHVIFRSRYIQSFMKCFYGERKGGGGLGENGCVGYHFFLRSLNVLLRREASCFVLTFRKALCFELTEISASRY